VAQLSANFSGVVTIDYSSVQGWTGSFGGSGNVGEDPQFLDPDGLDNVVGTTDDDLHVPGNSPCVNTGTNAAVPASGNTDLDGAPRILEGTVDMGAYEFGPDCNSNNSEDYADIAGGLSADCTGNGVPDECEPDCDANNVADSCDRAAYGDLDDSGIVDVGDVLCGLAGFSVPTSCSQADIAPCGGDGFIDVGDLLAILNAFAGEPACPQPC
jgi:hypothetical protein